MLHVCILSALTIRHCATNWCVIISEEEHFFHSIMCPSNIKVQVLILGKFDVAQYLISVICH